VKPQEGNNLEEFKGRRVWKTPNRQKKNSERLTPECLGRGVFQKPDWTVESLRGEVSIYRGPLDLAEQQEDKAEIIQCSEAQEE
jgi:hypothetical protein